MLVEGYGTVGNAENSCFDLLTITIIILIIIIILLLLLLLLLIKSEQLPMLLTFVRLLPNLPTARTQE